MSEAYQDTFFEKLKKKYKILVDLLIGDVYPIFYSKDTPEEISDLYCDSFPVVNYPDVFNYRSICKNVQNILSYLNIMIHTYPLYNNTKLCEYLSYYIYENVLKCNSCKDSDKLYTELNKLKLLYSKLPNDCNIRNFYIGKDTFEKKKKIYLLAEILYWIKEEYENNNFLQQYTYDDYFEECASIYNKIISGYDCNNKPDYNTELIKLKNNFNSTKAYLKEKHKNITHDDLKSPEASICQNKVQVSQKGQEKAEKEPDDPGESGKEASEKREKPGIDAIVGGKGLEGGIHIEEKQTLSLTDKGNQDINADSPNPNTSNPVGTIIGTSLGFVLPLITLYKFTPFGTWINTKILGRNNIMKNIKNNNQDFLLNSSEDREMELGDTMYRVAYNSVTK